MLKAPDKRTPVTPKILASYEESDHPRFGIAFWRKDGTQRFAAYAFLSAVDFDGDGELIFRFTHWQANVRGEALQPLWEAAQEGRLAQVRELDKSPGPAEPWVYELILAEFDFEPSLTNPPFPMNSETPPSKAPMPVSFLLYHPIWSETDCHDHCFRLFILVSACWRVVRISRKDNGS
jgi:hypothetical protein